MRGQRYRRICLNCTGSSALAAACEAAECPVFWRRRRAGDRLAEAEARVRALDALDALDW